MVLPFRRSTWEGGSRDGGRVAPGALGQRERDCRLLGEEAGARPRTAAEEDVLRRLLPAVEDLGHLPEVNRPSALDADDRRGQLVGRGEEGAGLHDDLPVTGRQRSGDLLAIRGTEGAEDVEHSQPTRGERGRVELDPHLAPIAAEQRGVRDVRHVLELGLHLRGHPPEGEMVQAIGVEGQREDRDVVDRAHLEQRRGRAGRDPVCVRLELSLELDQRPFRVVADVEGHHDQRASRLARRVDVLDAGDLPRQTLQRCGEPGLHLRRARPRHGDEEIEHRDLDLRLLLPGKDHDGQKAQEHRAGDQQRSQPGADERPGERAGETESRRAAHRDSSTRSPSTRPAPVIATVSPPARPEEISTRPFRSRPERTSRTRAAPDSMTKTLSS